jgi:uncharacterized protein (DUF2236 family)
MKADTSVARSASSRTDAGGTSPGAGPARLRAARRPIGPGSLLWRYLGDHRIAFTGLSAGLLQLLHPAIGAGVADHSNFFSDPWDRIIRSLPQIMAVVYGPKQELTARRIRNLHSPIAGRDDSGRPYRALDPETFWWAHATFQYSAEQIADSYDHRRLDAESRQELYLDGVEWYRRYGVSMKPVPPDRAAFAQKWEHHLSDVLQMNPAAERAIDIALHDRRAELGFLPPWTRILQPLVVNPVLRLTAVGGLPPTVRQRFSIPWGPVEELELQVLQAATRRIWRRLPAHLRYGPSAAQGFRAWQETAART